MKRLLQDKHIGEVWNPSEMVSHRDTTQRSILGNSFEYLEEITNCRQPISVSVKHLRFNIWLSTDGLELCVLNVC